MRVFNAFQLVGLFSAMPFIVAWLNKASFSFAGIAFWTAVVVYVVAFGFMVASVTHAMRKDGPLDW